MWSENYINSASVKYILLVTYNSFSHLEQTELQRYRIQNEKYVTFTINIFQAIFNDLGNLIFSKKYQLVTNKTLKLQVF